MHKLPPTVEFSAVYGVESENELEKLFEVLRPDEPTLIFCDKRSRCDKVSEFLRQKDIKNLPFYDDKKMTA